MSETGEGGRSKTDHVRTPQPAKPTNRPPLPRRQQNGACRQVLKVLRRDSHPYTELCKGAVRRRLARPSDLHAVTSMRMLTGGLAKVR